MFITKKLRRHSGRIIPRFKGRKEILIEQGLEPQPYWDDWRDYKDGFRGCNDRKMLRSRHMFGAEYFDVDKWNKKLKLIIQRRKVKQFKSREITFSI